MTVNSWLLLYNMSLKVLILLNDNTKIILYCLVRIRATALKAGAKSWLVDVLETNCSSKTQD